MHFACSRGCKWMTESHKLDVENLQESAPDVRLLYRKWKDKMLI